MKSMILRPAIIATMTLGAALGLAGCSSYDDGYGYSRVSLAYGNAYPSYYGWYDNYYYPGTGYYIYDRSGSRYRWNDRYRTYWEARRPSGRYRDNWSGYRREWPNEGSSRRWNSGSASRSSLLTSPLRAGGGGSPRRSRSG